MRGRLPEKQQTLSNSTKVGALTMNGKIRMRPLLLTIKLPHLMPLTTPLQPLRTHQINLWRLLKTTRAYYRLRNPRRMLQRLFLKLKPLQQLLSNSQRHRCNHSNNNKPWSHAILLANGSFDGERLCSWATSRAAFSTRTIRR